MASSGTVRVQCARIATAAASARRFEGRRWRKSPTGNEKQPEFLFRTNLLPFWASFQSAVRVGISKKIEENRNEIGQRAVSGRKPKVPIREEEIVNGIVSVQLIGP